MNNLKITKFMATITTILVLVNGQMICEKKFEQYQDYKNEMLAIMPDELVVEVCSKGKYRKNKEQENCPKKI